MKRRYIMTAGGTLLLLLLGWWALPSLITAVPGPVRYRLPEPLLALVTTPLPTALPAPERPQAAPTIVLPTLPPTGTPTPTSAPTLPPTFTPQATQSRDEVTIGTATPPATVTPLPSPTATATKRPLPAAARIDNMTIIPQKFNNCGPTNLTIVLNYYGEDLDQLDVAGEIRPVFDDRNVSPWQLVSFVNEQTSLRARSFAGGDLQILKELIAAGFPVIVEKGLELAEEEEIGWMGHYLTLFGYEDASGQFLTLDTFLGPFDSVGRGESYDNLMRYWQQFNNRFVVVYTPAREREMQGILGQTYLDPILMWQQAAEQAQTAIAGQPENAFAWFNMGGSLTHLADYTGEDAYYESAAAAFDQARTIGLPWRMLWYQFEPYVAYLGAGQVEEVLSLTDLLIRTGGGEFVEETHYYQGLAWEAKGESERAQNAYRRALAVNPRYTPALESYEP